MKLSRTSVRMLMVVGAALLVVAASVGCSSSKSKNTASTGSADLDAVAKERGLTPEDMKHALQQFVPPGKKDEYVMFSSDGQGGQVLVLGVPSMRILKSIAVFTPESWQGYGYGADAGDTILKNGNPTVPANVDLTWGDTHHPALSETNGDYDGRFLYINDRANGRVGMVDLRDFTTKQILAVPNIQTSHGGMFVTPNSDYVHVSATYPEPWPPGTYADLKDYQAKFRSASAWLKIDQTTGKLDLSQSFEIELPPYNQDLADAGKLVSDGWGFIGSYNSEMATGGDAEGGQPMEAGMSKNNFDYLHIINWKKAAEVVKAGKAPMMNGIPVISMKTAVDEGLLYLIPEPKSPHGADVDPSGRYIVVGGKLDPHVTIFDFNKIQKAIESKDYEKDDVFGIHVLKFDSVVAAQVEVGAGPLHTQFDGMGHGYTSMFLASAVAKFTLGDDVVKTGEKPFSLIQTIPVNYNIGHLAVTEGDTEHPDSKYLVALNKWSIDRFQTIGPLHPQDLQLIDLNGGNGPMDLISDTPIGIGEPHYAEIMKASRLKAIPVYPPGTDLQTMQTSPFAIKFGGEKTVRDGNTVEVWMTAQRSHFTPDIIRVKQGDHVKIHITNIEQTEDATHGFGISQYNINASLEPGVTENFDFVADKAGSYNFYCTEFCSALHLEMAGWLLVEPAASGVAAPGG
jgi:nitrous-oxide reductase